MSKKICGMTFDEYIQFHYEFNKFMLRDDKEVTTEDTIQFLKEHGQEPVYAEYDDKELDMEYYLMAGLKPWEDEINKDPEMQSKKAMALINLQNKDMHGETTDSADIEIEGLGLEAYAHICATAAGGGDVTPLYKKYGIKDQAHFDQINNAYWAAMNTDGTGMLTTHYSEFYMKYSPEHAANVNQMITDAVAEDSARMATEDERNKEVNKNLKKMAKSGQDPKEIADYVRKIITDADDEDELDWYVEDAISGLEDDGEIDAIRVLQYTRFEILDPGGDRDEWVDDEMESYEE